MLEYLKDTLNEEIEKIISDKSKLENMSLASKRMAVYNVEDKIYDEIKRLVG